MESDFKPDFGLLLMKLKGEHAKHWFLSFRIFHLGRVSDSLYCTTSYIEEDDLAYAVTIDFSEDTYNELLESIPDVLARALKKIFGGKFSGPQVVELPSPITVGIAARLGELTETASGEEAFVPFKAYRVFKIEDLAHGRVKID